MQGMSASSRTLATMLRMAIVDGTCGMADIERLAQAGVDYIQLRDRQLSPANLAQLARSILAELRSTSVRLLINSRADVALATGASGVHLTSHVDELQPAQVRQVFAGAGQPQPLISISCHSTPDCMRARAAQADLILFAPVFEKRVAGEVVAAGQGLEALAAACRSAASVPVLALGGVTLENANLCAAAGAAGIAGIRTFAAAREAQSCAE